MPDSHEEAPQVDAISQADPLSETVPAYTLQDLLDQIRARTANATDKGRAFEELCLRYLRDEPRYASVYKKVQFWQDWVAEHGETLGLRAPDRGIDLVATTPEREFHAVQCKFYDADHSVGKADIDSFISASGHKAFSARILIDTTRKPWSSHAEETLHDQHVPVIRISLPDLENSAIDWSRYQISQP